MYRFYRLFISALYVSRLKAPGTSIGVQHLNSEKWVNSKEVPSGRVHRYVHAVQGQGPGDGNAHAPGVENRMETSCLW